MLTRRISGLYACGLPTGVECNAASLELLVLRRAAMRRLGDARGIAKPDPRTYAAGPSGSRRAPTRGARPRVRADAVGMDRDSPSSDDPVRVNVYRVLRARERRDLTLDLAYAGVID